MIKPFGVEHFLYDLCVLFVFIVTFILINRYVKKEKTLSLLIRSLGLLLLAAILWNRISISLERDNVRLLLPDSYCGTSSLVLSLTAIFGKKDHGILHCVGYTGLLGGLITLIYPDFIGQADSIFYSLTISGLLHHTLMVFILLIMFSKGYIKPSLKKWRYLPLGLLIYLAYGLALITQLGLDDAMYILNPALPNTIFNWFGLGFIFLVVHFAFLLIWEALTKKKIKTMEVNS